MDESRSIINQYNPMITKPIMDSHQIFCFKNAMHIKTTETIRVGIVMKKSINIINKGTTVILARNSDSIFATLMLCHESIIPAMNNGIRVIAPIMIILLQFCFIFVFI